MLLDDDTERPMTGTPSYKTVSRVNLSSAITSRRQTTITSSGCIRLSMK